jgi:Zn-dependent protease
MSTGYWLIYAAVVLATLLVHEAGHWIMLSRLRIPTQKVTLGIGPSFRLFGRLHLALFPLGASVTPEPARWAAASSRDRFRVAVAGPAISFICAFVFLALSLVYPHIAAGLSALATLHFAVGAINILPIPPLDGWHIFTELLATNNKALPERASAIAVRLGNGVVYGMGFWFIGTVLQGRYVA